MTPTPTLTLSHPNGAVRVPRFGLSAGTGEKLLSATLNGSSKIVRPLENPIIALLTTDFVGMCMSRTGIEWHERGPDAARETAIRELSGLITLAFLSGWLNRVTIKTFSNRVSSLNPLGLPAECHINADTLNAFSKLAGEVLAREEITSPAQFRAAFIRQTFLNLRTNDQKQAAAAVHTFEELINKTGLEQLVSEGLIKPESEDILARILNHYALKGENTVQIFEQGTRRLSEMADKYAKAHVGKLSEEVFEAYLEAYNNKHLQLSMEAVKKIGKTNSLDVRKAKHLYHELTKILGDDVKILFHDDGHEKLSNVKNLEAVCKEMSHFLEQIVDRATYDPGIARAFSQTTGNWKEIFGSKLFGTEAPQQGMKKLLSKSFWRIKPLITDGLVPYAVKHKLLTSRLPILATTLFSVSFAFANNWLTRRLHGGRVFSPYEEALMSEGIPDIGIDRPHPPHVRRSAHTDRQLQTTMPTTENESSGLPENLMVSQMQQVRQQVLAPHFSGKKQTARNDSPVQQPRFGLTPSQPRTITPDLRSMDYHQLGISYLPQVKFIYAWMILSRWAAASTRSWNELRESIVLNSLGFTFWFYVTPIVERLFIRGVTPKKFTVGEKAYDLRDLILQKTEPPATGSGFKARFKKLAYTIPVNRFNLVSAKDLKVKEQQILNLLKNTATEGGKDVSKEAVQAVFKRAIGWVRTAKLLGNITTITLLGFVINFINIAMTRKNVAEGKIGKTGRVKTA